MKDALAPQGMFEDLGLKYVGPIDGHDRAAVEQALRQAKRFGGPVIVHVITRKGFGYDPAERHEADQFHQPGAVRRRDRRGARPRAGSGPTSSPTRWSRSAPSAQDIVGDHRRDAAPGRPATGSPRRTPSAPSTSASPSSTPSPRAAGLAMGGLHPVVAIYATFLNRAFDQVLMDVALHRLRRHVRARPRRRHRRRRRQPQRHVGHVDPPGRARPAARRARATAPGCASCCARRSRSTTPRPSCGFPKGPPPADIERGRPGRRLRRARPRRRPATC